MTALSIETAAEECPNRDALIVGDRHYSYAELAALVGSVNLPPGGVHRASPTLETALLLYASLQTHVPLALVSENVTDAVLADMERRLGRATLDTTALLLFTSGSSGASKGVCLSRRALEASAYAASRTLGWADGDRWLCCLPLSHIGGVSILLRCLAARRTAVLAGGFSPELVADALTAKQVTQVSLVPTMLWRLLDREIRAPAQLRVTLMGGAALDPGLAERAAAYGYRLRPSYGMTETASMIVCDGHPIPGVRLRLLDDGTLLVRGPMMMQGYLAPGDGKPAFEDGWLRTSDRARFDEQGHLEVLGRSDNAIISGGENIALDEVEAILRRHPRVHDCLALGLPDPEWGQRLAVLLVCNGDPTTIQCDALVGYKRPKELIAVERIPMLDNGKPDRQAALALAVAGQS